MSDEPALSTEGTADLDLVEGLIRLQGEMDIILQRDEPVMSRCPARRPDT